MIGGSANPTGLMPHENRVNYSSVNYAWSSLVCFGVASSK